MSQEKSPASFWGSGDCSGFMAKGARALYEQHSGAAPIMKSPMLHAFECATCDTIIETGDDVHIFGSQAICTECAKATATSGCPFVI